MLPWRRRRKGVAGQHGGVWGEERQPAGAAAAV